MQKKQIEKIIWILFILCQSGFELQAQNKKEWQAYKEKHLDELLSDARKPITAGEKKHIKYFPFKKSWQIEATYIPLINEPVFQMPTYSGITRDYRKFATATFLYKQEKVSVVLYQNMMLIRQPQFKDYLFLPFKDNTNGKETYGGGRYMDVRTSTVKDGRIILNFNKAYNPYCAYNEGFNCPIPPPENHLLLSIKAGERNFKAKRVKK
jgi:uncharacterized protein (DUF1684 family)